MNSGYLFEKRALRCCSGRTDAWLYKNKIKNLGLNNLGTDTPFNLYSVFEETHNNVAVCIGQLFF